MLQANGIAEIVSKTPVGDFDQEIDWTLQTIGPDVITDSAWSFTGPDNTLALSNPILGTPPTTTQIRVSGGTVGNYYNVVNTVTLTSGQIIAQAFIVRVVDYVFIDQPDSI